MPFKKSIRTFRWLSLIALLSSACGGKELELKDFDHHRWQEDKHACESVRTTLVSTLMDQRDDILAHNEMEIVELLGKPDESELYKRNQKFYYYYVEPGPKCKSEITSPKKLVIRFNAMGLAKEMQIE